MILTEKSNYSIILVFQGHLQIHFKFKVTKSQFQGQKCQNSKRSIVPLFDVFSNELSISATILMIKGRFVGQFVNFKVMLAKIYFLTNKARNL